MSASIPPSSPIIQFRNHIQYVRDLNGVYTAIRSSSTSALDLTDILRSELVLTVSALDHFIHRIVEEGILEIYQGTRTPTKAFTKFNVSMLNVQSALTNPSDTAWLRDQIRKNLGHLSFQKSEKISVILKLISPKKIWNEVAITMQSTAEQVTLSLDLIIDRRNKIAHEADVIPAYPYGRWPIDEQLVNNSINHVVSVSEAIFQITR